MDAAKAIALMMAHPEEGADYLYEKGGDGSRLPLILIPTTCGTGSEVTPVSVLTLPERRTKASTPHPLFADAALIDGAGHFRTMLRIYVPVSMPAIATMTLFCMVYHWNQWFDGMLYMDNVNLRPLQTFLRQTLIGQDYTFADGDEIAAFADINDRSLRCAQIIIATIPILCSYPFLQRYFVKGIIVGSVKG